MRHIERQFAFLILLGLGLGACYAPRKSPAPLIQVRTGPGGTECRELTQTIVVDGERQVAVTRACRDKDGNWQVE